jgi:hypothetical protein
MSYAPKLQLNPAGRFPLPSISNWSDLWAPVDIVCTICWSALLSGLSLNSSSQLSPDPEVGPWQIPRRCGVVCIVMREDTHVNMLPSPKGLVLEMEHEGSDWTGWLELRRSGECSRSWPVVLLPEDCWECCSSLGPARWGVLFSEAWWSRREDLAESQ